jgi:hypothetical protein
MHIPATVPCPKSYFGRSRGIPDGTYSPGSYAGMQIKLPREATPDSLHRNLQLPCHLERSHDVTVHSAVIPRHHGLVARLQEPPPHFVPPRGDSPQKRSGEWSTTIPMTLTWQAYK